MLLGEPAQTPFDLNFSAFGFPVRVSGFFWIAALILGQNTGGKVPLMVAMTAALFLSILIHELGHAFAFRKKGIGCHIVLYHFGGLAIPDSYGNPWQAATVGRDPKAGMIISLAGPLVQIAAGVLLMLGVRAAGYDIPGEFGQIVDTLTGLPSGRPFSNIALGGFVYFFLQISLYWAFLNLLPIYPLDGGQIARNLFLLAKWSDPVPKSLMLSVAFAAAIAFYGFSSGNSFMGIMFGLLAFSSFQSLQAYGGFGGGSGRRW